MIEKILERLEEVVEFENYGKPMIYLEDAQKIVQEVAKEYSHRNSDLVIDSSHRNGWIPVTERLPEPFQRVLVYDAWDDSITIEHLQEDDSFIDTVIAWMPLPIAPYQKGE